MSELKPPSANQKSALLKSNQHHSYNDEMSSAHDKKKRHHHHRSRKEKKSSKSFSNPSPETVKKINKLSFHEDVHGYNDDTSKLEKLFGQILFSCESSIKYIVRLYNLILFNAVIVCLLLIISRIFENKLFNSDIFKSDSVPLLLAANVTMMISYSLSDYLTLRLCLSCGCTLFALWGLTNDPMLLDTFFFNFVMMLLNLRHAIFTLYRQRYIFFEPEYEQIYCSVFKPYLKRNDFLKLVNISYKRHVKKNEIFKAKGDEITSLCCLVNGRISVVRKIDFDFVENHDKNNKKNKKKIKKMDKNTEITISSNSILSNSAGSNSKSSHLSQLQYHNMNDELMADLDIGKFVANPHFVNLCHSNQFIEAPQWVYNNLNPFNDRFTVSFIAVDDSEYIKWPRENLINLIEINQNIYNALQAVLGLHTAKALLKSREYNKMQHTLTTSSPQNNMNILTGIDDKHAIDEDKIELDAEEEEIKDDNNNVIDV